MKKPLVLTVGLNVLEHLGMNLYSSVPAVLSEVVANAWDADAQKVCVEIDLKESIISIRDDGCGMTRDEFIDRFLFVGYKRREEIGDRTPHFNRLPMGRKGIGKLSSFSIANVVTVFTLNDGERTSGRMDATKIRARLKKDPKEQSVTIDEVMNEWPKNLQKGTCIVLSEIGKKLTRGTEKALRQRIARRFSVIGPANSFNVSVNGTEITPSDRGFLDSVEYLWVYGQHEDIVDSCRGLKEKRAPVDRTANIASNGTGPQISGWIGTVSNPKALKGEDNENLNNLAVFMRGKLCHEDLINDLGISELYANYLVGEIHCDDLDADGAVDMATSNRQSLKRDDPRFEVLLEVLRKELRYISNTWSEWRREDGSKVLAKEVPAVQKWLELQQGDVRKKATHWIGRLNNIQVDNSKDLLELMKASVLAFEHYARRNEVDHLDGLSDEDFEPILKAFDRIDSLELSYYGQIVKFRIGVIRKLEKFVNDNERENRIRDYIYKHLWLLDPTWERVSGSETVESNVRKFLNENTANLTDKERRGRIDIGYRKTAGAHVIVELKRAEVRVSVDELVQQVTKYRTGVRKILQQSMYPDWPLEIVVLLGRPPREFENTVELQDAQNLLAALNVKIVYYNQLLSSALNSYQEYLEQHAKYDPLYRIFEEIDDFATLSE